MAVLIVLFCILAYISIGIFIGSFWYRTLHKKWCHNSYSCGGMDSLACVSLGIVWPVSVFLYFLVNMSVRWVNYLIRAGNKIAIREV